MAEVIVGETVDQDRPRSAGYRDGVQYNAVVETNLAAVHLWQSLGFHILGTVPEAFNHAKQGLVGLHVMHQRPRGSAGRAQERPRRRSGPQAALDVIL